MSQDQEKSPKQTAADTPPAAPNLEPEQFVEQLRALRAQVAEVSPLTSDQRKLLRQQATMSDSVILASISVIGASDTITSAVGTPAGDVRVMVANADRWDAVENELKATLNGVAGANLIRRQKIAIIAAQAYGIGKQLARVPQNADLVPHVAEVKHQRTLARRKKRATQTPGTPAPAPGTPSAPATTQVAETTPAADTSMTVKKA
jgi:hypothetical protein